MKHLVRRPVDEQTNEAIERWLRMNEVTVAKKKRKIHRNLCYGDMRVRALKINRQIKRHK